MPSKYVSVFDEQEQIEYMSEIEPIFSLCSYNTQKKNSQAFTKRNEKNTYIYDVIKEMGSTNDIVCLNEANIEGIKQKIEEKSKNKDFLKFSYLPCEMHNPNIMISNTKTTEYFGTQEKYKLFGMFELSGDYNNIVKNVSEDDLIKNFEDNWSTALEPSLEGKDLTNMFEMMYYVMTGIIYFCNDNYSNFSSGFVKYYNEIIEKTEFLTLEYKNDIWMKYLLFYRILGHLKNLIIETKTKNVNVDYVIKKKLKIIFPRDIINFGKKEDEIKNKQQVVKQMYIHLSKFYLFRNLLYHSVNAIVKFRLVYIPKDSDKDKDSFIIVYLPNNIASTTNISNNVILINNHYWDINKALRTPDTSTLFIAGAFKNAQKKGQHYVFLGVRSNTKNILTINVHLSSGMKNEHLKISAQDLSELLSIVYKGMHKNTGAFKNVNDVYIIGDFNLEVNTLLEIIKNYIPRYKYFVKKHYPLDNFYVQAKILNTEKTRFPKPDSKKPKSSNKRKITEEDGASKEDEGSCIDNCIHCKKILKDNPVSNNYKVSVDLSLKQKIGADKGPDHIPLHVKVFPASSVKNIDKLSVKSSEAFTLSKND